MFRLGSASRLLIKGNKLPFAKVPIPLQTTAISTPTIRVSIILKRNLCKLTKSSSTGYSNQLLPHKCSRNFHFTSVRRIDRYPFGNRFPFGKRSPIRIFTISPIVLFFASIGTLTVFFLLLPFLFTFLLPMFIAGVSVYQFRKWKNITLISQLLTGLKRSHLRANSQTLNALYVKSVSKYFDAAENSNAGVFEEIFKGVDERMKKDGLWPSATNVSDASRLVSFVKSRVMEAIENDEQGIRTYFLGNDVSSWIKEGYDFELDPSDCNSFIRGFKNEIIFWVAYPLYLKSSTRPKRYLADVLIAIGQRQQGDGNGFDFFLMQANMIRQRADCNMVISVRSASSIFPKQFVITDGGESGHFWAKYDIDEKSDGHTEYTIRNNE